MKNSLLLIGGSNVDFIATSDKKIIRKTSNIGQVSVSHGGVMRNIAENLARLGNDIDFITAIGNDSLGEALKNELTELGIKVYSPKSTLPTGMYIAINDVNHDMSEAICDNRIIEDINIEFLKSHIDLINKHDTIVIDTNLTQETIDYLFNNFPTKKFILDGISPLKVMKVKKHLDKIYLIKCNIHEARALMGIDLIEKDLVSGLLARGIKNVVVSHGSHDIYFGKDYRKVDLIQVEAESEIENTTGCGDALTSGVIDYYLNNKTLKEAVAFGNKLANLTLKVKGATSKEISKFKS